MTAGPTGRAPIRPVRQPAWSPDKGRQSLGRSLPAWSAWSAAVLEGPAGWQVNWLGSAPRFGEQRVEVLLVVRGKLGERGACRQGLDEPGADFDATGGQTDDLLTSVCLRCLPLDEAALFQPVREERDGGVPSGRRRARAPPDPDMPATTVPGAVSVQGGDYLRGRGAGEAAGRLLPERAGRAVGQFAHDVGVADVAGRLLDHVDVDPPQ